MGGPGAEQIENLLYRAFQAKPGAVLRLVQAVKKERLRPTIGKA